MKIAVLLAPGFEDIEAITPVDVLRRAGFTVVTAAVGANGRQVTSAHQVTLVADCLAEDLDPADFTMTVFPGGLPGATNLAASQTATALAAAVHARGGWAAAICAAPVALHAAGLLAGHAYTCYPSCEQKLGGHYTGRRVERDKRVITACGPGASLEFALELVRALGQPETAEQLAKAMLKA
ncbi:MAG: DJ-1/PfpI family protein [Lentisphaeria bacterium]|jgi:4-methyl-5(b-hydroxyethyl)-thiazole monophosphate biosynthesis|nr:DJ-1/PfpI family protein [Lentisphaeria bacterium]